MASAYDLLYGAESPSEGGTKKGDISWAKDFDAMFGLDKVEPYVESPGMLQRLRRGFGNTVDSVKAATAAESGDRDNLAEIISQNAKDELPQSTAAKGIYKNLAPAAEEAKKAEGFVDNVTAYAKLGGKAVSEFASNPREFAGLVLENLPNSAPGLAGSLAGGASGTAVAGPLGAAVGTVAGGTAGGYLVEQGGSLIEQVSKAADEAGIDRKDKTAVRALIESRFDEMLKASRLKGVGTAGTDALINVVTLGVAGAGERTLAKAARQIEKGVKDGTIAAEQAAQSLGVVAAKQAARNTLGRKTLRGVGVVAGEGLGEGASEAAGQKLAYGEVDPLDVVMESVAGVGMGVGSAAARGTYQRIIGQDNNSSVNAAIEGAQAAIDGSKTGPSESQQRAKAAFGPSADPETAKLQEQDKARIALALSSLDDAELDAATTHLAGGDQQFKQLLSQLARDENVQSTSQSVYSGGTQEYVNVADSIRRDAGITETDTGTTDTTTAVGNSVRQQQSDLSGELNQTDPSSQSVLSEQSNQSDQLGQTGQLEGQQGQPLTNSAGFYAEPMSQLKAQLLALGDGKKSGVVMGAQEAEQLDLSGFSVANVVDPETGATAVFVGRDDPSVQAAVTRADEVGLKQAAGEFLGYSNPTATTTPTENMVAVQQLDESGNVIQEEAVTAEQAAGVSRIPGAQVRVVPLQQAMTERQQLLLQERQTALGSAQAAPQQQVTAQQPGTTAVGTQQPTAVELLQTATPPQQQSSIQQPGMTAVGTQPAAPQAQPATEAPLRSQGTGASTVTKRVKDWVASFNKSIGQDPAADTAVDDGSIREFKPPKTSSLTQIAQSFKEAFGVNVMYVETPKGGLMRRDGTTFNTFNGFVDPATNTLVMHVDAATPLNTFGHEQAHLLKSRFPQIYAKLELTVLSRVSAKRSAEFRAGLQKSLQEEGNPTDIEQEFRDELVAESIGEMTQDPAFWKDVFSQLGEDGSKAKTLYDTVMEMISKLAQKFTKNKYVPGVKDMQKVRRAATDAFVAWSAATQNRNNLSPFSVANLAQSEKLTRLKPLEQKVASVGKDGLSQFSRQNILAVTQGNRIAPMAVLDKPTKSLSQSGLKQDVPIRMEQSVVEKLLTGKDGLRRAMTPDEILDLKAQIETPVAIFDDPTDKGSVVVLTSALIDGEPMVIAISKNMIEKTYSVDNVSSLGKKMQGGTTEKAKFSPLKTAFSKDVGGILRWVQTTKVKHFDMGLATKAYGKELAPITNALNVKAVADKAYRVKEGVDGPLIRPAYNSAPSASTLKQQGNEPSSSTEISVTQPARIGSNTLTLRKKLDSLMDTRFSRNLTSDENQDGVGIADDSNAAPDVVYGRDGVVEKNRRWMSGDRKGQYIGAPDAYNTPGKIAKLRSMFRDLAKEGIRGRFWYEESGKAVLKFVGGNSVEARKFISLLAIYSPQAKVNANTTMALSAWEQYKSGQPIDTKTELQDGQATEVLYNNKQWGGEKTNNFYKNLMREVDLAVGHPTKQGATIDMWMMRAAGYESDAPTAAQYRFVENETNLLAKELGWEPQQVQAAIWAAIKARTENKGVKQRTEAKSTKAGFMQMVMGPKGKPVRQINNPAKHRALWLKEAFGHEVTEDDTTQAIYHFGTALGERSAQLSWEATPGASTGVLPGIFAAPVSQQREYLKAIQEALQDENGHDLIDKQIGLLVDAGMTGNSGWNGEVSVGVQQQAPVYIKDGAVSQLSRNLVELSLAIRGLVLKQEGMAWHMPIWGGPQYENNGVEFNIGRQLNSRETAVLYKALSVELGHTYAPPIPTKTGFRVLNFPKTKFLNMAEEKTKLRIKRIQKVGKKRNDAFHKAVANAVGQQDWANEITEAARFQSDGNLIENDWGKGDEDYRRAISEKSGAHSVSQQSGGAKRPDLLKWVDDELVPRVNRVNERFAEKYGWGEPTRFSRTADAAPAARLAEPAGRPSVGRDEGKRGSTVTQAIHYGKQQGLSFLSGASFGTGIKGAEQARLSLPGTDPRIKRRVYFYLPVPGGIPAPESGLGNSVYAADIARMFDPDGSIKGFGGTELERINSFESAVLDAGYRGYINREQGTAVVMGEDVPVSYLGTAAQFNKVQRIIERATPKIATRTEGSESVRRMDSTISLDAKAAAKEAAPSFKLEYGEARVKTEQKDAANAALAGAGSQFQFSRANLDGAPLEISIGNATLKIKDAGDAVRTLEAKIKKHEQLLSCLG